MDYEIWLGNDFIQFERGLAHYADGTKKKLCAFHNVGTYNAGSVLIDEVGNDIEKYPLRWYPKPGVIEFYDWDQSINNLILHNEGDSDIYIFGYAYLKPGESANFVRTEKVPHYQALKHYLPIGLVTLNITDNSPLNDSGIFGKKGLLLEATDGKWNYQWKFILPEALQGNNALIDGFKTSVGAKSFENGCWTLTTENSKYTFSFD